ncbi:MAG: siroheme synthase CysG [Hyphomicrobiales bacterium]
MDHLPILFDVRGKFVAVVGGGTIAARKTEMVLRAGGRVTVFAPELGPDFREILRHDGLSHSAAPVTREALAGAVLAYGASEEPDTDNHLFELARELGIPANIADTPDKCDFIMPAILDRDPMVIAISSSGASPILARIIKARLESVIPAAYGRLARFVGRYRDRVSAALSRGVERRRFWERILEGPVADLVLAGADEQAEREIEALIAEAGRSADAPMTGEVYLVGAGPGDPDLLTFKALRLIQRADVVLYDRLIDDCILNLVRRDAERIYVGKMNRDHTMPQEDISRLMVRLAREGRRVLRLKGGDPFIFGRGGEEIEELARESIPFQVVPGITAASGCSAYAGIPLTHRDHAQACIFVTGHGKNGKLDLDWKTLLQPHQTVVIYMGLSMLPELSREFLERGASAELPVAVVDHGTRRTQRVVSGTIADIAEKVAGADFKGPSLVIIGSVVTLRDRLKWYAPESSASDEGDCLRSLSLDPIEVQTSGPETA